MNNQLNDELKEIPEISDEKILEEIIAKTSNIHAAYIFWADSAEKLLKNIALILCATPCSLRYNGWVELGTSIGLKREEVKTIENNNFLKEDPVYVMFNAYSQQPDATIGKIYIGLSNIKRLDVIRQTYPLVTEFYKELSKTFSIPKDEILKPLRIPKAPHIFKNLNLEKKPEEKDSVVNKNKTNIKFNKIVILTYSSDDEEIAKKIAQEFRKTRNGKTIGVFILNEHRQEILMKREKLILNIYRAADYIIPILTNEYLTRIFKCDVPSSALANFDDVYAPFIFDLMSHSYLNSGCKNKKIRCIIPDYQFNQVRNHDFFQHSIFQAWIKLRDIDEMAEKILDNKI